MRNKRALLVNLLAALIFALPCLASVIANVSVPATRATGDTITAAIWNNDVIGVYSYINNTLAPVLNVLTTKGDQYVYTGAALARQGVGANNTVFTADSAQVNGVKWVAFANTTQLTTKGDLLGYAGAATRVAVGVDGQVLTADSTQAAGFKWANPPSSIPSGTITAWSPAFAGTSTIPLGWLLCDGTSSTPNLIGRFIIGTRPTGSVAAPATGGYGALAVDGNGTGTATHTHTFSLSGTSSGPTVTASVATGTAAPVAASTHTHTFSGSGTGASATSEPADYALVYIMKQ